MSSNYTASTTVKTPDGRHYKLEFQNGQLVKVGGMRPEYMSGQVLLGLVRQFSIMVAQNQLLKDASNGSGGPSE